ncbi:hypothetical protein ABPG72_017620 [Tetrahymena utriculariae]
MSLISNKSNFCSTEFLNQIKLQLENINPLLEDIPTQNMFIQGQKPIEFQQLTDTINDGDKRIQIKKNNLNQYEVTINEEQYNGQNSKKNTNCMLNMILDKDKKYIFRVQFKSITTNIECFQIGLTQHKNLNIQLAYKDQQYIQFQSLNNKLKVNCVNFVNYLKGTNLELPIETTIIEFRVWLNGKILQISDYPQNNYKVSIKNEKLDQLQNLENLQFFLQQYDSNRSYIITEALIVEEFVD